MRHFLGFVLALVSGPPSVDTVWWSGHDSNVRPAPCKGATLPLSYPTCFAGASMTPAALAVQRAATGLWSTITGVRRGRRRWGREGRLLGANRG